MSIFTSNKNPKIKMAAIYGHFKSFKSCMYYNFYQNDKWLNKAAMWYGVNTSLICGFSH